jgi:hypothetical protein
VWILPRSALGRGEAPLPMSGDAGNGRTGAASGVARPLRRTPGPSPPREARAAYRASRLARQGLSRRPVAPFGAPWAPGQPRAMASQGSNQDRGRGPPSAGGRGAYPAMRRIAVERSAEPRRNPCAWPARACRDYAGLCRPRIGSGNTRQPPSRGQARKRRLARPSARARWGHR